MADEERGRRVRRVAGAPAGGANPRIANGKQRTPAEWRRDVAELRLLRAAGKGREACLEEMRLTGYPELEAIEARLRREDAARAGALTPAGLYAEYADRQLAVLQEMGKLYAQLNQVDDDGVECNATARVSLLRARAEVGERLFKAALELGLVRRAPTEHVHAHAVAGRAELLVHLSEEAAKTAEVLDLAGRPGDAARVRARYAGLLPGPGEPPN